ncbi:unnamed protein product [Amoebophrya sp. A120]|nr:unnamed protein product [Amoebophrya sp. A120]|eukprot:GSA120T00015330001.1
MIAVALLAKSGRIHIMFVPVLAFARTRLMTVLGALGVFYQQGASVCASADVPATHGSRKLIRREEVSTFLGEDGAPEFLVERLVDGREAEEQQQKEQQNGCCEETMQSSTAKIATSRTTMPEEATGTATAGAMSVASQPRRTSAVSLHQQSPFRLFQNGASELNRVAQDDEVRRIFDGAKAFYKVELVVFANEEFQLKYKGQLASLRCYADKLGYQFHVFSLSKTAASWARNAAPETREGCLRKTQDVFFLRHCLLAAYLDSKREEDDRPGGPSGLYFALDSDIGARGFDLSLRRWAGLALGVPLHSNISIAKGGIPSPFPKFARGDTPSDRVEESDIEITDFGRRVPEVDADQFHPVDVMLFERAWGLEQHNELMAGALMVRNTPRARRFLRQWASWEQERPQGYSSADNGAIHLAVPEALGIPMSHCQEKFATLTAYVSNLTPYANVLKCVREHLGMGSTPLDRTGKEFEKRAGGLLLQTSPAFVVHSRSENDNTTLVAAALHSNASQREELISLLANVSSMARAGPQIPTNASQLSDAAYRSGGRPEPSSESVATMMLRSEPLDTLLHPARVIPGLRVRILAKEDAWAPDWWASKTGIHPLGHGLKNMTEGLRHQWFSPDMLACLATHGVKDLGPA